MKQIIATLILLLLSSCAMRNEDRSERFLSLQDMSPTTTKAIRHTISTK